MLLLCSTVTMIPIISSGVVTLKLVSTRNTSDAEAQGKSSESTLLALKDNQQEDCVVRKRNSGFLTQRQWVGCSTNLRREMCVPLGLQGKATKDIDVAL